MTVEESVCLLPALKGLQIVEVKPLLGEDSTVVPELMHC